MVLEFFEHIVAFISQPWPWWVGGLMIGFVLFLLFFFGKEFGISANLRIMCAADGAGKYADFFEFDWDRQSWNLMVALGAMFGGYFAANYFVGPDGNVAHISEAAVNTLNSINFKEHYEIGKVPIVLDEIYNWKALFTLRGLIVVVGGGFLVGFGARYAGGCTSGHAISGLANLQLPSLIAVIGFFTGGLIMTYVFLPMIMGISI
jgi:uncharacterized protein